MRTSLLFGEAAADALPALRIHGRYFQQVDGARYFGIGTSDLNLVGAHCSGVDVRPVLQQRHDLGITEHRTFTRYWLKQWEIGNCTLAMFPDLYERISELAAIAGGMGQRIAFVAYSGFEDFDYEHWERLNACLKGFTNARTSLVNEGDQPGNKIDRNGQPVNWSKFKPIPGMLCSRGSNGSQAQPPDPTWGQWSELHLNDAPQWGRKPHNGWSDIADIYDLPCDISETTTTAHDASVDHWEDYGACSALAVAAAAIHSPEGKNSTLFREPTLSCVKAFVKGIRTVNLSCQQVEPLIHRQDLEATDYLRVYQRADQLAWIRKAGW